MNRALVKTLTLVLALSLTALCLVACAQQKSGAVIAGPRAHTVNPTRQNVRLIGRTCETDGTTWLPQSGSAVEFTATGTRVQVEIVGDKSVTGDASLCPRFAVLVDGEVVLDDTLDKPSRIVEAFSSDTAKTSVVQVIHLTEAKRGAIGVKAITVESDTPEPVKPTDAKELSIEFIGDSITCGYGVDAAATQNSYRATDETFMKSYAYYAAQALNADYSAVCYSGYGVISGWTDSGERNAGMLVPPLYRIVAEGYGQPWDFASHSYDVVVINLGTNDSSYTGTNENRLQEFARAYADFLVQVRACNPDSHIVCTMGTMGYQHLYPYVEQAVESFKNSTGDARVICYLSEEIDYENDGVGAKGHPNEVSQRKSADVLVDVIRQTLQTES